mgnify:CR=1 FL=1
MNIERSFISGNTPGDSLPNELLVVFGRHAGADLMLDLAARLSVNGFLYLLDCGNRSNMYRVAKTLHTLTNDPVTKLKNIRLSRAFTCYQVTALLEKLVSGTERAPVLVLDLLTTFMDESVQPAESRMLFDRTLENLLQLSQSMPVVVSAKPLLSISSSRFGLLEELKSHAFQVWEESVPPVPRSADVQLPLLVDF